MSNGSCPKCNEEYIDKVFGGNKPFSEERVAYINMQTKSEDAAYCNRCGGGTWENLRYIRGDEVKEIQSWLQSRYHSFPLLTLFDPAGWKYTALGMVTSQSTSGTGVIAEFKASITDLFGMQSETYNKKIRAGEVFCMTQVRMQAIEMGGNAILGADVKYSELGGDKGMIMVCVTGTAVLLHNTEVLGEKIAPLVAALSEKHRQLVMLKEN